VLGCGGKAGIYDLTQEQSNLDPVISLFSDFDTLEQKGISYSMGFRIVSLQIKIGGYK